MASKEPRTSSRTVVLIVIFQALQLLAVAVSLVDDAQRLSTDGEGVHALLSQASTSIAEATNDHAS